MATLPLPFRAKAGRPRRAGDLRRITELRAAGQSWRTIGKLLKISPRKAQKIVLRDLSTARMLMPERHPEGCFVYFVLAREANAVKIGYTANLGSRVVAISTHCPYEVQLLAALPWRERLEEDMHELFAADSLHGEWFKYSDQMKEFIAANGGDFSRKEAV